MNAESSTQKVARALYGAIKFLIFGLLILPYAAFAREHSVPDSISRAEVCELRDVAHLTCVDEKGHPIFGPVYLIKQNGWGDNQPEFTRLSTLAVLRQYGLEARL